MKLPRDINAEELIKALVRIGYKQTRQTGSHIRLSIQLNFIEHSLTIPNHKPIRIGTLNNIILDIAKHLNISKNKLIEELF
jgi:predicted RNA binding protein YcfA (HicA-like mRNA interferase family)